MSDSSSDSVDLSLSFSVSSVESEEYEASESEVSDHSPGEWFEDTAESRDDDSGDK